MLTLYIANKNYSSWSLRPWFVLKMRGIAFTEQMLFFNEEPDNQHIKRLSPSGRVPVLVDAGWPEGEGVIWDSLAIVEYLAQTHPSVWPTDLRARAWARSASAEMHAGFNTLRHDCSMNVGVRVKLHHVSAALQNDINRIEQLWTQGLTQFKGPWLAGQTISAVDAFYAPVAFRFQTYGITLTPPCQDYVNRLLAHPVMQQWEREALLETHRDPDHDRQIESVGTLTCDLRSASNG